MGAANERNKSWLLHDLRGDVIHRGRRDVAVRAVAAQTDADSERVNV